MQRYDVILIDTDPVACPEENTNILAEQIRRTLTGRAIHIQRAAIFPPAAPSPPDLVLFRSSLSEADLLSRRLAYLKKRWPGTASLGLFCLQQHLRSQVTHLLLNGLDDFVSCPFRETDLLPRIERLLLKQNSERPPVRCNGKKIAGSEALIGRSPSFLKVVEKIPQVAGSDATILIFGETGTGKELVAQAIHSQSSRRNLPFIPVNCGAFPDHLFENELFGHARGAYTDAASEQRGLITEAEGGTLFLDEIDSLCHSGQVKLLRFLQNREFRPLGSSKNRIADVRIIAATNADLDHRMEAGLFRKDLYYRLHVVPLSMPPLRERGGDILLLAEVFMKRYAEQYQKPILGMAAEAIGKLLSYPWPGNVRELEGVIQRATLLGASPSLQPEEIDLPSLCSKRSAEIPFCEGRRGAVAQMERAYLVELIARHRGNISQAARTAGIDRRTLQRLMRKHGFHRDPLGEVIPLERSLMHEVL